MKKLAIAAALAAGVLGTGAPVATAGPPEAPVAPCASVNQLFETANVQMEPLPEPLGSTSGTVVRTVCNTTG